MGNGDRHFGWLVSPYSAKTRSYLKYIEHDFDDVEPTVLTLAGSIRKAVGRPIMPTVRLKDGRWLQDSSAIIDHYEHAGTYPSIDPPGRLQKFAVALLEVFADEWLPMVALHYRWHVAQNEQFALNEFARSGIPWLPRFLGKQAIKSFAAKMKGYLPVVGVCDATISGVEETAQLTIATLEKQLSCTRFVLGNRPCTADFSLYGPLWAHLYRDPGSRYLFDEAPHVVRWMEELTQGVKSVGDFLPDDDVPASLDALFECALTDQWSWIRTLCAAIETYCSANPDASRVPRALGEAPFVVRGLRGQRKLVTFVQWKAQRAISVYDAKTAVPWIRRVLKLPNNALAGEVIPNIRFPFDLKAFKTVLRS
jgi:glutathione S-transferase